MKDNILEPDTGENPPSIPLYEVVPAFTNHKALSDALRRDMRDASKELLKLREWMSFVGANLHYGASSQLFECVMQHVDDALAALDCTDHITPEPDATP